jgi:hypothetical protein
MPSPAATVNAVMIDANEVCVCGALKAAILTSAQTANAWAHNVVENHSPIHDIHLRLRHLAVISYPASCQESGSTCDASLDSLLLDYEQVPDAVARMVVQLPSTYAAGTHGTITASLNGNIKTFKLDTKCDETFQYVFSYSQSVSRIHAPRHGSAIFLLYDVVSMVPMYKQQSRDNCVAEARLAKCVQFWEQDAACEKLAVVLHGSNHMLDEEGNLVLARSHMTERDRAVVSFLKSCPQLEVGYAGRKYFSVCMCVCVCIYVCIYACARLQPDCV